jgi:hypothetical protein
VCDQELAWQTLCMRTSQSRSETLELHLGLGFFHMLTMEVYASVLIGHAYTEPIFRRSLMRSCDVCTCILPWIVNYCKAQKLNNFEIMVYLRIYIFVYLHIRQACHLQLAASWRVLKCCVPLALLISPHVADAQSCGLFFSSLAYSLRHAFSHVYNERND